MSKDFSQLERKILQIFINGSTFFYDNKSFKVEFADKPTCPSGEPKTDIYILANSQNNEYAEFKISFKKKNADFLENKTNAIRAEKILGPDWENIIYNATMNLEEEFFNKPLIYKRKFGRTEEGSITLGWKFEILNKPSGKLSGNMLLNYEQVLDVYAGIKLPRDKRNAFVNNQIIEDSGIANFLLIEDSYIRTPQDVIDSLIPIECYVQQHPQVYFACKALNYRTFKNKYDGDRPLSVYVDWFVRNNKLAYEIIFDTPLHQGGNFVADNLKNALYQLGIHTTDDLNELNVEDPNIIHF